ncbi:MAG: adenosylmethionine decarboxylase [Alteromonadaceae bacterium]|jgi:S-adenosylmethionine decarboxylase|tara:strand:- start:1764 stop:2507 length:744 start_codon:yes stop_codon:yes gene_type:complete
MEGHRKIQLYGFNNLTKSLSFSFYKLHYLENKAQNRQYNTYIKNRYNADKLTTLMTDICHAIGGSILNVAQQDYQPQGASVTLMISEEAQPESLVAHLDKSHICVHTYPDDNPTNNTAIFRADLELSTCGVISPLKVLNYLIKEFEADVIDIDYRIRGMTRSPLGAKQFNDQLIDNISDCFSNAIKSDYSFINQNLPERNLFHSRLCRKDINPSDFILPINDHEVAPDELTLISNTINKELIELYTN